jgi:hypothetical protein
MNYSIQEGPPIVMARREIAVRLRVNHRRMRHLEQYWYARYWRAPKSERGAIAERAALDITSKCVKVG